MAAYTTKIVSESSDQNYWKFNDLLQYIFSNIYNTIFIDLVTKYTDEK